ncbi:sugar transporter [Proteiniphilum sp.]|uniref:lipopolysaccharide biosynthesis protein n=1 Tax=Proteiniphilum sp. TaxID=1926877 RepID=UPI002B20C311|nr:sugar transporter [Proteiniphilum sp.]MEA4915955.1 sugar transporter [Proteiniphilum sp.]
MFTNVPISKNRNWIFNCEIMLKNYLCQKTKMPSRAYKSLKNVKIGMLFYIISLILTFFSRKVFLDNLGVDFIGLTGTLNSILNFLNLAELGIGSCVCFFLYKPIERNDHKEINEIISVLGYMYKRIGSFILVIGISVSFFFPLIFRHTEMYLGIVYFAFYSFLASSVVGYFINYRQVLLTADQKNYIVTGYLQTANILKTGLQILLAYYYKNLYIWVAVEFVFSFFSYLILNQRIQKNYPWLLTKVKDGKILLKKYPDMLIKTKQIFIQKIKDFILIKNDEILIFAFVSLKMVAYYGNYMIIINKLIYLVNVMSDGMGAGVGNLVAENKLSNTIKVFWELTALRFIIVGIVIFSLFLFMQPFIACWLGKEFLLSDTILYLLLIHIFIMLSRGVVQMYIHAYGLYSDVWASWTEVIINILVTFIAGYFYGITGILIGKIVSVIGIALLWKPYYLFKFGIKQPFTSYWKGMFPYYVIFGGCMFLIIPVKYFIIDIYVDSFFKLLIYAIAVMIPLLIIYFFLLYKITSGMKYFMVRLPFFSKYIKSDR